MIIDLIDNVERSRFEMPIGDEIAFVNYHRLGNQLMLTHTEVPSALRGTGAGTRLVRAVLDKARAEGAVVVPICPFVKAFLEKHPEYQPLTRGPRSG
jgi:predicted GNAT family acetyltransferase